MRYFRQKPRACCYRHHRPRRRQAPTTYDEPREDIHRTQPPVPASRLRLPPFYFSALNYAYERYFYFMISSLLDMKPESLMSAFSVSHHYHFIASATLARRRAPYLTRRQR